MEWKLNWEVEDFDDHHQSQKVTGKWNQNTNECMLLRGPHYHQILWLDSSEQPTTGVGIRFLNLMALNFPYKSIIIYCQRVSTITIQSLSVKIFFF